MEMADRRFAPGRFGVGKVLALCLRWQDALLKMGRSTKHKRHPFRYVCCGNKGGICPMSLLESSAHIWQGERVGPAAGYAQPRPGTTLLRKQKPLDTGENASLCPDATPVVHTAPQEAREDVEFISSCLPLSLCWTSRSGRALTVTTSCSVYPLCVSVKYAQRKDNRPESLFHCRSGPMGPTEESALFRCGSMLPALCQRSPHRGWGTEVSPRGDRPNRSTALQVTPRDEAGKTIWEASCIDLQGSGPAAHRPEEELDWPGAPPRNMECSEENISEQVRVAHPDRCSHYLPAPADPWRAHDRRVYWQRKEKVLDCPGAGPIQLP